MKKSSILVTLFLVVALIFAVSCPGNSPALKVTSPTGTSAAVSATVGEEKDIPVKLELANDAFVADKVKTDVDLKEWFTLSDGISTSKATVTSAIVSKVSAAESTTKADAEQKLVVAELTLKVSATKPTEAAKPVTVAIKIPAEKDSVKYTESGKEITASANDIKITITAASKTDVTGKVGGDKAEFVASTADTTKNVTVTLTGGTFANTTDISVKKDDTAPANFDITYTIGSDTKKNELTIALKSKASIATSDAGTYKIDIPASAIAADATHTAKALSLDLAVAVTAAPAGRSDIKITSDIKDYVAIAATKDATATATFTLEEGGTWTDTLPTLDGSADKLKFEFAKKSNTVLTLTVTALDGVTESGNAKLYTISLTSANITVDDTHKLKDNKLEFKVMIRGASSNPSNEGGSDS